MVVSNKNRLRCPKCGAGYSGDITAVTMKGYTCEFCTSKVDLQEEDPEGMLSGALPPFPRLAACLAVAVFAGLSVWLTAFAIPALLGVGYLVGDIITGHRRQRADRIAMWNRLRDAHVSLASVNKTAQETIANLSAGLKAANERFDQISPEKRDQLAGELATQQQALGLVGGITELRLAEHELKTRIKELKKRVISFEEDELLQSFGFYQPLYDCADSNAYRQLLDQVRDRQKAMVKDHLAVRVSVVFSAGESKAEGKKIAKNLEKLVVRAFNGECESTIDNVSFSNVDAIQARIKKSFDDLNAIGESFGVTITHEFLKTKIEELHICYEYQMKLKAEREEQRRIREDMREQARLAKEIDDARRRVEKEETHFTRAIAEIKSRMDAAAASEREQYLTKLKEMEEQLAAVEKDKAEVEFRAQSTRAGYVYVISNLGSFGEHVYKIGVTRRLEPQERIDELGDASVPFDFDVHAMIFSDDAPSLETALHQHFAGRAVNRINPRKEFFRVTLPEIEEVVRTHHNKVVEFTRAAKAEDYRMTMAKERAVGVGADRG